MNHHIQRLETECPICLKRTEWRYLEKREVRMDNGTTRNDYWRKFNECGVELTDESLMCYRESLEERLYEEKDYTIPDSCKKGSCLQM